MPIYNHGCLLNVSGDQTVDVSLVIFWKIVFSCNGSDVCSKGVTFLLDERMYVLVIPFGKA